MEERDMLLNKTRVIHWNLPTITTPNAIMWCDNQCPFHGRGIDFADGMHVFFILRSIFSKAGCEIFLVFLPYKPRMFLKYFLINQTPNHHSDDSDVPVFAPKKKVTCAPLRV